MSEFSMNSISDSLRRTIEDIKEITGQHSDEDIYEMLKDCNMDPNETAQKLLYLDTFHEVKRKRDRRKVRRGGGNQSSSYKSAGGAGRRLNPRREDRSTVRDSKSSSAVHHKESNKAPPNTVSSTSVSNGSSIADQNIKGVANDTNCDDISKRLPSLRHVSLKHLPHIDPGPTPTSTPTNISTPARDNKTQGGDLKPKSSLVGNSVGLYSSSTDPVLVPSLNPRNGSVGIIKRETGNQRNSAEISSNIPEDKTDAGHNVVFGQVVGCLDLSSNTRPVENQGVESNRAEPSHHTGGENGDKETCLAQQDKAPSKAEMSEAASEANQHSLPIKDPISEQSTSETDTKQHKQHATVRESVIFPNYLHVPEAFKNSFTFGSLEASTGSIDSSRGDASVVGPSAETSKEPSIVPQSSSSSSDVVVDIKPAQENASSNTTMRYDQSKQEMQQSVGGVSLNPPTPPSMPDYGLNFIPPVVGPHPMQLEGIETQVGNSVAPSSSTPSTAQLRGVSPSSIAMPPPQMFPYLRQTYPPNYIPYNPYFSHLYMPPPQNAHQLLSHPPSASSMYMPSPAASTGIKFPVPPVYKPGNVAPNMSHYGYGSYGPNYGPTGGAPPFSNDDIGGGEIKDKNTYSTVQQNEDLHAFANGRDPSTLQTNIMYNLPQAQAMAFQNSYSGLYHPSQAMPTRSLVQPVHQAQPTGSPLEPTAPPPLATYSQPQPQLLPQYGQMNWNQKFFNRENV